MLLEVSLLLERARRSAGRTINALMTITYWQIGQRIVEQEQEGADRAAYGEELVARLAKDLSTRFGRGFSRSNVFQMRQFFLAYREKVQTLSGFFEGGSIVQTLSGLSQFCRSRFPWSHYASLADCAGRSGSITTKPKHYAVDGPCANWTGRSPARRIIGFAASRHGRFLRGGKPNPDHEIRDPFVLEFLNLKDEYSESDLKMHSSPSSRSSSWSWGTISASWLVKDGSASTSGTVWICCFFNRRLRCLVVIDLKIGKFTHADAGQMNLYLNYAREHWTLAEENPLVGLILCSEHDNAVAHYALEGLKNTVLAREYQLALPDEERLAKQIEETRHRLLES